MLGEFFLKKEMAKNYDIQLEPPHCHSLRSHQRAHSSRREITYLCCSDYGAQKLNLNPNNQITIPNV